MAVELAGERAAKRILNDHIVLEVATGRRRAPEADLGTDRERGAVERGRGTCEHGARQRILLDDRDVETRVRRISIGDAETQLVPLSCASGRIAKHGDLREGTRDALQRGAKGDGRVVRARRVGVELKAKVRAITVAKDKASAARSRVQAHFDADLKQIVQIRNRHILHHAQLTHTRLARACACRSRRFGQRFASDVPRASRREAAVAANGTGGAHGEVTRETHVRVEVRARRPRLRAAAHTGNEKEQTGQRKKEKTHSFCEIQIGN